MWLVSGASDPIFDTAIHQQEDQHANFEVNALRAFGNSIVDHHPSLNKRCGLLLFF